MNIFRKMLIKKPLTWAAIIITFILAIAAVQAALPTISLNSPVSFPVDI